MFSEIYEEVWNRVAASPEAPLDQAEFGSGGALDMETLGRSRHLKAILYDGALQAVSPLYVTSICKERCTYCNYRAGSSDPRLQRVRLSDAEIEAEVEFLVESRGLRVVELVYASDPLIKVADIARHITLTRRILERHGAINVGLSCEPLAVDDYRRLVDAGLGFSVVWMETYDRARYVDYHPGTQTKSDFFYRLDCYDRMIEAGVPGVGYGVLNGLADWRAEWSMLFAHQRYLRERLGRGPNILGFPRLKAAPGASYQERQLCPTDAQLRALVAQHNILFPEARPFISTRENYDLCLQLASGGGCLFTFNCSTVPGGYTKPHAGPQFASHTFDTLSHAERVRAAGHRIVWDWREQKPAIMKIA
jgi:2-iminoacetate synthase